MSSFLRFLHPEAIIQGCQTCCKPWNLMHAMHNMHHRKSMLPPGRNTAHVFSAAHGLNAYHESNDVMNILNVLQCLHCRSFMHCMHMLHCKTLGCSCSMSYLFTFCICVQLVLSWKQTNTAHILHVCSGCTTQFTLPTVCRCWMVVLLVILEDDPHTLSAV